MSEPDQAVALTAELVAAYVEANAVPAADLPALISAVHRALADLERPVAVAEPQVQTRAPAVPIRKSITPDFLISLEDGRPYKSLRRHLRTKYGMTPEAYRTKWGLPKDYPMVAPNYAASRSALAKKAGLGRKPAPAAEPAKPAKRGRKPA